MASLTLTAVLVCASVASAQQPLPVSDPTATLSGVQDLLVYTIDLDTLPARPRIVVDVVPDAPGFEPQLEIELTNFTPDPGSFPFSIGCPIAVHGSGSWLSASSSGAARLDADLFYCHPGLTTWDGIDADVHVRVLDMDGAPSPLSVSVDIKGITWVAGEPYIKQVMGSQTVTLGASQDTVIYADDPSYSNGAGDFLWAGTRVVPSPFQPGLHFRYPRRSLVKFDGLSVALPENALIGDVSLDLFALSSAGLPGPIELFAIETSPTNASWFAGSADAADIEFFGAPGSSSAASYLDRSFSESWATPGGDTTTLTPLDARTILSSGRHSFDAPAVAGAVQDMVDANDYNDGFLLSVPPVGFSSSGIRFASANHPDSEQHPEITVAFTQPEPLGSGRIEPNLVDFLDEGEDFRWIYDLDGDGVFVTEIGGVCETSVGVSTFTYPVDYSYIGTPGFVGIDCCTWRVYSAESEVSLTGQTLHYHNLDPLDPANFAPDWDGDGIFDGCDSCQYVPNAELRGSCMTPAGVNTGSCESDLECAAGETCDKYQLDEDSNFIGDACDAPEPGFGLGLLIGVGAVGALRARRRVTSVKAFTRPQRSGP